VFRSAAADGRLVAPTPTASSKGPDVSEEQARDRTARFLNTAVSGCRYATLANPGSYGRTGGPGGGSTVEAERTAHAQMQPKIKRTSTEEVTYVGLVWKKSKSDTRVINPDDVIRRSKDAVGSSMKPTCCLCSKTYSPELMYVRCERCRSKSIPPMSCHCSSKVIFALRYFTDHFLHLDILLYTEWFHGDEMP
jgi:hypothetical protein